MNIFFTYCIDFNFRILGLIFGKDGLLNDALYCCSSIDFKKAINIDDY